MDEPTDFDPHRADGTLDCSVHAASGSERAWALLAFGRDALHAEAVEAITDALTHRGVGVLRVAPAQPDAAGTAQTLSLAAAWLRRERRAPALLVGHGEAGTAALRAALDLPECRAVAVLATPHEPRVAKRLSELEAGLLVLHASEDDRVSREDARALFDAAPHAEALMTLDGADHALSAPDIARYAGDLIGSWAVRKLPGEAARDAGALRPAEVDVSLDRHRFATRVVAGGHELIADEPAALGGTDRGPTPYELLLAALGSCTAITLRMYADRKGWALDDVRMHVRHKQVHAEDCVDCERERRALDQVETSIVLEGDLDETQRARLMEIAERCPVHRTLEAGVRMLQGEDEPELEQV